MQLTKKLEHYPVNFENRRRTDAIAGLGRLVTRSPQLFRSGHVPYQESSRQKAGLISEAYTRQNQRAS